MCDYCGCRRSGPTAELAAEHVRLRELAETLHAALHDGTDAAAVFDEFVQLLQMHAAKEEVGLFVHAAPTPLGDQITELCREHDDLRLPLELGVVEVVDDGVEDLDRLAHPLLDGGLDVHERQRREAVHAVGHGLRDAGPHAELLGRIDQRDAHDGLPQAGGSLPARAVTEVASRR